MDQFSVKNKASLKIAFIKAQWHKDIVDRCYDGFNEKFDGHGDIDVFDVPGAYEIPLLAKRLAGSGKYDAVVAAAFVVDGGIYRHEFVADAVVSGMMQVALECEVPVLSAVLTPHHFQGSKEHHDFFYNHFVIKGEEAAEACLSIVSTHRSVEDVPQSLAS